MFIVLANVGVFIHVKTNMHTYSLTMNAYLFFQLIADILRMSK